VGHTPGDAEARGEFREIGLFPAVGVGGGALLGAQLALQVAQGLGQVDALDGAVPQRQGGRAGQGLLEGRNGVAAGGDVEVEGAAAFQGGLLDGVLEQGFDGDAVQGLLDGEGVVVGIDADAARQALLAGLPARPPPMGSSS